jgi:hypothetical protein
MMVSACISAGSASFRDASPHDIEAVFRKFEDAILSLLVYMIQITRIKWYLTGLVKLVKYLVELYVRLCIALRP